MNVHSYWQKMKGSNHIHRAHITWSEIIWSWIGSFFGITAVAWVSLLFFESWDCTLVIGSLGSSAVLTYGAIRSPLAQPRNLIGGHIISAIIGVLYYKLIPNIPWLAGSLAVSSAIAMMHLTKTLHPPGGATALIAIIGSDMIHRMGWLYVLFPATIGPLILLIVALLINNIPQDRHYPETWF